MTPRSRRKVAYAIAFFSTMTLVGYLATSRDATSSESSAEEAAVVDVRGDWRGSGNPYTVETKYKRWVKRHEAAGGDTNVRIGLTYDKGLCADYTEAAGKIRLDLIDGKAEVKIVDLPDEHDYDVWLIQNVPGEGRNAAPEVGDKMLEVGRLERRDDYRRLDADLDLGALGNMDVQMVVVVEAGKTPDQGGHLYGWTSFFQDRYSAWRKYGADLPSDPDKMLMAAPANLPTALSPMASLVDQGEKLFFEETFEGNGRTCGTCHPANHNFTIDPEFIACLPSDDRLFLAEFDPQPPGIDLDEHFEKPQLMRKVGLILENTNGFTPIATNFTMRSVPHTISMTVSLEPSITDGGGTTFEERTGWSADGSPVGVICNTPVDGSLKSFAVGACRQHFTKTLARNCNPFFGPLDFRVPTNAELEAMECFQLSIGRDMELDNLSSFELKDERADFGRQRFMNSSCNGCHLNAGATVGGNFNANFNTGVELIGSGPGFGVNHEDLVDPANNPFDDGLGSPGDDTFNTPVLVEAADTGPFFHNNAIETIEGSVAFYNGMAFQTAFGTTVGFQPSEIVAVAAFLRVINAEANLCTAIGYVQRAIAAPTRPLRAKFIRLAIAEIEDACEVLDCGGLCPQLVKKLHKIIEELQSQLPSIQSQAADVIQPSPVSVLTAVKNSLQECKEAIRVY